MDDQNQFKAAWERIERPETRPAVATAVVVADYEEFQQRVMAQEPRFVKEAVRSLYAGEIYVLKGGFPKRFMEELREKVDRFWKQTPPSFHKMVEGCPDFHRIQDEETAKKYVFQSVRHSAYFFQWNGDPLGIIPPIMARWRIFKFLGGYRFDEYERNTPKDGVVDRIQIARYLPKVGASETHADPYQNQKFFISAFMSKRGVDYQAGGFYVVGRGNTLCDLEGFIDVGDIGIGYATVMHGVDRIDPDKEPDWNTADGRWWLGLYSNSTDVGGGKGRATGQATPVALTGRGELPQRRVVFASRVEARAGA